MKHLKGPPKKAARHATLTYQKHSNRIRYIVIIPELLGSAAAAAADSAAGEWKSCLGS